MNKINMIEIEGQFINIAHIVRIEEVKNVRFTKTKIWLINDYVTCNIDKWDIVQSISNFLFINK